MNQFEITWRQMPDARTTRDGKVELVIRDGDRNELILSLSPVEARSLGKKLMAEAAKVSRPEENLPCPSTPKSPP